jgi:hypothetical protein
MLYAGRSLEVEQLLMRPFLQIDEKYEHGWRLIFKINIFIVISHEPLRLEQRSFVQ